MDFDHLDCMSDTEDGYISGDDYITECDPKDLVEDLRLAIEKKFFYVAEILLKNGAEESYYALIGAAMEGDIDGARYMWSKMNRASIEEAIALAEYRNRSDITDMIIESCSDIFKEGLKDATSTKYTDIVYTLLRLGVSPNKILTLTRS